MPVYKDVAFAIKVVGEVTGEEYAGNFKAKPILSHGEQLEVERLRRELIGEKPDPAAKRAMDQAIVISELAVRITEAPMWWREARNGLELYDDNVIASVHNEALKVEKEFKDSIQKKAEAAKKDLEKLAKE